MEPWLGYSLFSYNISSFGVSNVSSSVFVRYEFIIYFIVFFWSGSSYFSVSFWVTEDDEQS
jgi:hypothetical protein